MLTNLSKEQEKLMYEVRDEWLNNFFSLEFDQDKAEKLVDFVYSKINKTVKKIFVDSPFGVQFACNLLTKKNNQVRNQVNGQVRNQVMDQVMDQVWDQVNNQVMDQVRNQVSGQVWDQVGNQVNGQVRNQVWSQVGNQVRDQVMDQVMDQVEDQVKNQLDLAIEYFPFCEFGDIDDYGWVSFYDFFSRISIVNLPLFTKYKEYLNSNIFLWVATKDFAVISKPPVFLKKDEQHRLHCLTDYAIAFKDGYGQHYVHGIYFDPDMFVKFFKEKKFHGTEILALKNVEQKAVILQEYGFDKVIKEINATVIDEYLGVSQITGKPVKYELIDFQIDELKCRAVKVEDHTTHKIVTLGVPVLNETKDCLGAIAWTFRMSKDEYKLKLQS